MSKVFCISGSIVNSLGTDIDVHWDNVVNRKTCLVQHKIDRDIHTYISCLNDFQWNELREKYGHHHTKCALLCIEAINVATKGLKIDWNCTAIVLATTKGDIDLYSPANNPNQNALSFFSHLSAQINAFFKPAMPAIVLSNACISGSQAIQYGAALLQRENIEHVIVCGVDIMTKFTLTGFNCLKALSALPARPFDRDRDGISLGEAAAALVLSKKDLPFNQLQPIQFLNGFVSNDANHISGPSRTGEGLFKAISMTLEGMTEKVDAISLHGTATIYNDDMESIAINRSGLDTIPCFGIKGIYGHTLGAAGILESIISLCSMSNNTIPATVGCSNPGTSQPINILTGTVYTQVNTLLKSVSGFGGSNCVLLFQKSIM